MLVAVVASVVTVSAAGARPDPRPGGDSKPLGSPSKLSVTVAAASTATIEWMWKGSDSGVAGFGVYLDGRAVGTTVVPRFELTTLACGTTYQIAVDAFDATGARSKQVAASFVSAACADTHPPTPPVDVAVLERTDSSLTLRWGASSDDVAVVGYELERDGIAVATTAQTGQSVAGLACGTSHTITVRAYDAVGNRSPGASIVAATSDCVTPPPGVPQDLRVRLATESAVSIVWSPPAEGPVGYYAVSTNGSPSGTTADTGYTLSGLTCGSTLTVGVATVDPAGSRSTSAVIEARTAECPAPPDSDPPYDLQSPTPPDDLTVTDTAATTVGIAWNAARDNVGVTGYEASIDGSVVGTTALTSYLYAALACGTSRSLAVRAYDAAGNRSAWTTATAATRPCIDSTPPSAPTELAQTAATETTATLSWKPSTDDRGVVGYGLYRNSVFISETTSTSFVFQGLSCSTVYSVAVDAADGAHNRSARITLFLETAQCPPGSDTVAPSDPASVEIANVTASSFSLSWVASTDNVAVAGYRLYRSGSLVVSTTKTSYAFTGLACGQSYTVGVEAFDAAGNVSGRSSRTGLTNTCTDTQPPTAPTGLAALVGSGPAVTLSWDASSDDVAVAGYAIYRDGVRLAESATTAFSDVSVVGGITYGYSVRALDSAGNVSPSSVTVTITPSLTAAVQGPVLANVWLSPGGGESCTRVATPVASATARSFCADLQDACIAATGGDVIGVKVGVYRNDVLPQGTAKVTSDCSDGLAGDYNPNAAEQGVAPGSVTNWVRVVGDVGCTRDSIVFSDLASGGRLTFQGNNHLILDSTCVYIHNLNFGQGPDTSRTTQNVHVIGAHVDSIEVRAAKNILVKNFEGGPVIQCGKDGHPSLTEAQECDPAGPRFEAQFANRTTGGYGGNTDWEGVQIPKVSNNAGGYNPVNVRFENGWLHDLQTRDANLWHTGCGILQFFRGPGTNGGAGGSHNVVLDRIVCERVTVQGFFIEDADGVTIQNSVASCPTHPYNQTTPVGGWGQCAGSQRGLQIKAGTAGWTPTNILWRYNAVETRVNLGQYGAYSNVRLVGNIYRDDSPCEASKTGVAWSRNVAYGPSAGFTCGTNSLHAGSVVPWVDTSYGDDWSTTSLIDYRLTPGTKPFENWITETSSDYAVLLDAAGAARPSPRTAGPFQR